MKYTREEEQLIKTSFEKCRFDFDPPLDPSSDNDVLQSLRRHHDLYNMNSEGTKIAHGIYAKHGLWTDGKTTLEEHNNILLQKKIEKTLQYKEFKNNQAIKLKELRDSIDKKITELEERPVQLAQKLRSRREGFEERAKKDMEEARKDLLESLQNFEKEQTEEFKKKASEISEKLRLEIESLVKIENDTITSILAEYDELQDIKSEYTDTLIRCEVKEKSTEASLRDVEAQLLEVEVKEMEEFEAFEPESILEEEDNYDTMTLVQLRNIAKDKGVQDLYSYKKVELIDKLREM